METEPKRVEEAFVAAGFEGLDRFPTIERELRTHPAPLARRFHQICVSIFLACTKKYDITPVQYSAMRVVEAEPGINQAALGKLIALDRQTISNVVRRLVEKRLIERRMKDARTSALYLTGASRALLQVIHNEQAEIDEKILAPLSGAEQTEFMTLLVKLVSGNNELSRAPMGDVIEPALAID